MEGCMITWEAASIVPHFEKMLYDQGQLVNVFLDAFAITKDVQYASFARDILDYIRRDMTDPEGGIYSAEVMLTVLRRKVPLRRKKAPFMFGLVRLWQSLARIELKYLAIITM